MYIIIINIAINNNKSGFFEFLLFARQTLDIWPTLVYFWESKNHFFKKNFKLFLKLEFKYFPLYVTLFSEISDECVVLQCK